MHKAISRALWGAFFVGGLTVLGTGAAHAADTSGEDGIASGNQVGILADLPVTIVGNAVSVLGDSHTSGATPAITGSDSSGGAMSTSGENAIAGGNQVLPVVHLPIVVGGNSVSVIGDSSTDGAQASAAPADDTDVIAGDTNGEEGIASGNQVFPALDAPVTVSGNDVSLIRDDDLFRNGSPTSGLLENGLLDGVLVDGPILRIAIIDDLVADPVLGGDMITEPAIRRLVSQPVIAAPVIDGPILGDVQLDVLAPVAVDSVAGNEAPRVEGAERGLTPLMATAALAPAMLLAATGVEALPLLGGIALMLATGLVLVGLKRVTHTVG
jgi:hypothetical protein